MWWEERKRTCFTENTMQRGLSFDKALCQVLTDLNSEEESSPSDNDVESSSESESAAAENGGMKSLLVSKSLYRQC